MTTIWHNPRCSTSRATLKLLRDRGIEPEVRLYLDNSPDPEELEAAAKALGLGPRDFIRSKEPAYKTYRLGPNSSDDELFAAMAADPKLIERPIVFKGDRAALGRPPEAVLALF
jgi:arsenate reductase